MMENETIHKNMQCERSNLRIRLFVQERASTWTLSVGKKGIMNPNIFW